MIPARTTVRTARYRLAKAFLAAGVATALAWGPGFWLTPAGAAAVPSRAAVGVDPLAAWAVTAADPVTGGFMPAVNPATNSIYIGDGGDGLSVLDGLTGKVTGTIALPGQPFAAAVDSATGTLYAVDEHVVTVASTKTNKVTATIADAMSPGNVAVDPKTDTIYIVNTSTISVIDGHTNKVTATIDLSAGITGIAVDPLTNTVYVSNIKTASVSVIDGATNAVTATIGVGQFPDWVTIDPVTDRIYVANLASTSSVSEIDGTTNTVIATLGVDARGGIAADPRTDTIYVLDSGGDLGGLDGRTNHWVASVPTVTFGGETAGTGLAVDPAAGTIYAITAFSDGVTSRFELTLVTSCRSHVAVAAGSNCAKVAASFEPAAATFASPADGVVLGTTSCAPTECFQAAMMATADGGKHWRFVSPPPNSDIEQFQRPAAGVLFTSPGDGWLYGTWHTRNGGATWQHRPPPTAFRNGNGIALALAASGTTVYEAVRPEFGRGRLYAAPIGTTRWTRVPAITADAAGLAVSGHSVWVVSARQMWASTDGQHWRSYPTRCPGTGYQLAGVAATSPSDVTFLCAKPAGTGPTDRKEVLTSADGGRTVHLAGSAPAMGIPDGLASPPGNPAVITIAASGTGPGGTDWLYRSADGGRTWITLTIKGAPAATFRSLTYTSPTTGWIILATRGPDSANVLLHTTNTGRSWNRATL